MHRIGRAPPPMYAPNAHDIECYLRSKLPGPRPQTSCDQRPELGGHSGAGSILTKARCCSLDGISREKIGIRT